jgi:L-rhamnose-H+ transport protein
VQILLGIGFALLGGVLQGAMLWPMKFMDKWDWENTWLGFSVAAYLLAPWVLALWSVPHLPQALGQVSSRTLGLTFLFGLGWGLGTVLFGLGIASVGLGLGYAIIMGLTVSVGTLIPLLALAPQEAFSRRGLTLIVGVAAIIAGTSLCSYAGKLRERRLRAAVPSGGAMLRWSYRLGVLVCVCAGILIPGGNLALTFGSEITRQARALGASPLRSVNALWAVTTFPLFLCSAVYCLFLLRRNRSFAKFGGPGTGYYWLLIIVMGAVQMAGIALYGFGAASLGMLGTSIGFSILMSSMIITANALGVASGEWKGAGGRPANLMAAGLAILTAAIFLIGYGTRPGA